MEVIVNEDQLSLAIGKKGQNVRLATKLVGWNIDIRSEEEIKKEVALQMGALIASGEAVPLSVIQGVTAQQAETLAERGIKDIDSLAATSVDDLVDILDLSLDEAETILGAAQAILAARDASRQTEEAEASETGAKQAADITAEAETAAETVETAEAEATAPEETPMATSEGERSAETDEPVEQHAVSAELDETVEAGEVEPSEEMIAEGYDEAVEQRAPFQAEERILAQESADPVALTEADPISPDELLLQEVGRDLRPDTITPAPDITSSGAAYIEAAGRIGEDEPPTEEEGPLSPVADFASQASAPEVQTTSAPEPIYSEAAVVESVKEEKQDDASDEDAAQ
jgi:N utilization substance protein A